MIFLNTLELFSIMDIGRSIMNPNFTIRMTIDPKTLF
jgi:hypothetical protein